MSYFDEHGRFNFNYDKDTFSKTSFSWTTPKPPRKPDPPFMVFGSVIAVIVIWAILRKICCPKKENAPDTTTVYSNSYNRQMPRTMPVATIISERSSYLPSSNYTTNSLAPNPPTRVTPTAPHVEHQQPHVFQPTAPRMDEGSIPMYDNPPNYDEAIKIMNQQKDHNSPIT